MGLGGGDPSNQDVWWSHHYINLGELDAIRFKLVLGTIEARTGITKQLDTDETPRVERNVPQKSDLLFHEKDFLDFFFVCFIYNDERGHHSDATFYEMQEPRWRGGVRPFTPAKDQVTGFSCTKFETVSTQR
jgi:hypothetical protein